MKLVALVLIFLSFHVRADWGKAYEQEKIVFKDFEKQFSIQHSGLNRPAYLNLAIEELKRLGSLFFLQKYVREEIGLGKLNPKHFAWALETEILTEDYRAIRKSLKLWKDAGNPKLLGGYELSVINYASFLVSNVKDPLDPHARKIMNTEFHDRVLDVIIMRKLEKKDFSNLTKIIQMKDNLYFEDKMLLSVLGECTKTGEKFAKYCNLKDEKLTKLKEEYPEIMTIQFL